MLMRPYIQNTLCKFILIENNTPTLTKRLVGGVTRTSGNEFFFFLYFICIDSVTGIYFKISLNIFLGRSAMFLIWHDIANIGISCHLSVLYMNISSQHTSYKLHRGNSLILGKLTLHVSILIYLITKYLSLSFTIELDARLPANLVLMPKIIYFMRLLEREERGA